MKDWKTTLPGLIAAGIIAEQTIAANQSHTPINWAIIGLAFCIGALGVFAKQVGRNGTQPTATTEKKKDN